MDTNGTDEPDAPSLIRWTSQAEVQRRLGISRTTLYRWRTLHGLPAADRRPPALLLGRRHRRAPAPRVR